ncbi:MAG TPA: glycosyl hydrolase [Gemmatimonadales bacterium]|nr:glycosyl hydrolase [Gemmatimonadales bacterium]
MSRPSVSRRPSVPEIFPLLVLRQHRIRAVLGLLWWGFAVPATVTAQRAKPPAARTDTAEQAAAAGDPALRALHWRLVGPFRGGRAVAVAGDPTRPLVFYFGAVDGGVWKTTNAGQTWTNITDGRAPIASVGAIAVAPSDPNVLYVGAGEADWREDLTYGDGMWRSTDGGATWRSAGLADTRHIAAVRVDPSNPEVVYVAAMGHAFGPNLLRGVFRTSDGGKTWIKVLYADDSTGAIDLALDPSNPRVLYAALWKSQRFPWGFAAGGGRSGLWKSVDGGDTWTDITASRGLPPRPLGRIGIAVSPANASRVWASVEARDSAGGIFRSDDGGASWERVNAEQKFMVRPWYFSSVAADPADENALYVLNLATWRSVDAGKTFSRVRVPHGDCHTLWIDPKNPQRLIEGNDGGATVSLDGGASWSSVDNQPTAQFYHVTTDDQVPYRIYGAQQDNSTVAIASRSDDGAIGVRDWYPVGGGESGYIAPQPGDPNIVFAGTYMGTLTRYDHRTRQERDVSVWLNNYDGYPAADVPYRFQWTFPIVFSPHDRNTLYVTAQRVFKTTDGGSSWRPISPDLTVHDPATLGPVGGPITRDMTGTEWYATVFAFAESPMKAGVLWAGSDDGLVHVSQDSGTSWADRTPKGLGRFTRMSVLEPSHFDAGVAYLAANRYQQDDIAPYLFKTADYGRTWTKITTGLPEGAYTRAIREDPVRRGLLFAGTETGIYVSFDDGGRWQPLQLNLPRASVRDITVHGGDLVVATHGRAFWVLDDISPLRQLGAGLRGEPVHLFTPDPAVRFQGQRSERPLPARGANPLPGAAITYWLDRRPASEVTLAFLDSSGAVVRSFTGKADSSVKVDSATYVPSDSAVPAHPGTNRFVWNLRATDAKKAKDIVVDEGTVDGPLVPPGRYSVKLTVAGQSYTQPLQVVNDPRVAASRADLLAQYALALAIRERIDTLVTAVERLEQAELQLASWTEWTKQRPEASRIKAQADSVKSRLEGVRGRLSEPHAHADESTLHWQIQIYNQLLSLNGMVQSADAAPTAQERAVFAELSQRLDRELAALRAIETSDLTAFNRMLHDLNVPAVGTVGEKR